MATSTDLLNWFRLDMDDLELPYLWSDAEVFEYATDAQRWFCRKTEGIADSRTVATCQLAIVPATEWYTMDPRILKLRAARRGDTGRPVPIINPEKLNLYDVRFDGNAGVLKALIVGLTDGAIRAYPVPSETVTINLEIFRLPLLPITGLLQALEIAEQHHRALVMWMRYRAYCKQDADTLDLKRAADYEQKFDAYCFKALAEQERARRAVGTTIYGGI